MTINSELLLKGYVRDKERGYWARIVIVGRNAVTLLAICKPVHEKRRFYLSLISHHNEKPIDLNTHELDRTKFIEELEGLERFLISKYQDIIKP